jgi:hypothetical protein
MAAVYDRGYTFVNPRFLAALAGRGRQLAAAVGPASLLARGNVVSLTHVPVHAAASCEHHSGSKLHAVHGWQFENRAAKMKSLS